MKPSTKGEQPTFANKAAEYANNRSELQIEALIKRKTPNAALTITQDVILSYARRGRWSPIRRTETSKDLGIIHIWEIALSEVFERTPGKGKHVIEFLKQILSCTENRDEIAGSRKLTIEFLFDIVLRVILPADYRIPIHKELWLELLPLFDNNPIAVKYFEDNWRRIHQERILDLIDGIMEYLNSKNESIFPETPEAQLVRHLWRTFNLQENVSPWIQVAFAQILKPIIPHVKPKNLIPTGILSLPQIYKRASKAVRESMKQALLIADLQNEILNQIVKPDSFIKFSRFEINDDGELQQILFDLVHDENPCFIVLKKVSIKDKFQNIVSSIRSWAKKNHLNLKGVRCCFNGNLKGSGGQEKYTLELNL